jgi:hypothetical protein
VRATDQETRGGHDCAGSDDEHADAVNSRANDFHEFTKVFHQDLSCRKARRVSMLFLSLLPVRLIARSPFWKGDNGR